MAFGKRIRQALSGINQVMNQKGAGYWVLGTGFKVFKDPILIPGIRGCFIRFPSWEG